MLTDVVILVATLMLLSYIGLHKIVNMISRQHTINISDKVILLLCSGGFTFTSVAIFILVKTLGEFI